MKKRGGEIKKNTPKVNSAPVLSNPLLATFLPPFFFRSPISSFLFIPRCEKKKKKRNGTRAVRRSSSLFNFPQIAVKFVCSRIEQISFQFGFFFSKKRIVRLSFLKNSYLKGVDITFSNVFFQDEELKTQGAYK